MYSSNRRRSMPVRPRPRTVKIQIRFYNGVNGIKPVTHRDAIMALALEGGFHDISHALLAFNNNDVRHDDSRPLSRSKGRPQRTVGAVGAVATEGSAPLAAPIVFWQPPPPRAVFCPED